MLRSLTTALLVLLAASPAMAILTPTSTALGWTRDGSAFVWTLGFDTPETWTVVSATSGKAQELRKQEDFDGFVAKHPLAPESASGLASPDGKVRVTATGGTPGGDVLRLERKARVTVAGDDARSESFDAPGTVAVHWSPDGRRVALFYEEREECKPTGTGDYTCNDPRREVIVLPVKGPRVQLLGKGLDPQVFDKAAAALGDAGFAVTGEDAAQTARERSVVYAPRGLSRAARAIAAAVPGGATVDVLSWKTRFDVVVALGASAR